jgi:glycosyltransferase involved in cell wall biosynthesis
MIFVIHISNTDIKLDSRIRKELLALSEVNENIITAIGVANNNIAAQIDLDGVLLESISLWSRRLKIFPRAIRYFFEMIEFTIRTTWCAKKIIKTKKIFRSVVHCHDTFALPSGYILKWLCDSVLVYDAHELESNKNGQNKILSLATLWIEKFCWSKVDLLVSVSDSIIEWYRVNFSEKPNVLVLNSPLINYGSRRQLAKTDKNYFHEKFNIPKEYKIFVYLGILGSGRGIEACLGAFEKTSSKACVVFIGFGPLESKIAEYSKRSNNVYIHAPVPHEQVVGLVAHADYGLCLIENISLSDYLCLPNKLFEYSFAGLSILGSDFPEIRKVVDKYSLGFCCNPTVEDLIKILENLDGIQTDYTSYSIHELSWQVQAERLRQAYTLLCKQ